MGPRTILCLTQKSPIFCWHSQKQGKLTSWLANKASDLWLFLTIVLLLLLGSMLLSSPHAPGLSCV